MKIYLKLVIAFLLTLTLQVSYANCDAISIDFKIRPATNCSYSNGFVTALVPNNYTQYHYVWIDLTNNKPVSITYYKYAFNLKAGDYKLILSSKKTPECKTEIEFFVHGKFYYDKKDCSENYGDVALESIEIVQNSNGTWDFNSTKGFKGEEIAYRINNTNQKASSWDVVPKPATSEGDVFFKAGNTYEFAATPHFDFRGFVLSPPVIGNIIYVNTNKLSNTNNTFSNSFPISPQPANDYLNVELDANIEINSFEILNLNGQLLIEKETPNNTESLKIDVTNLNNGLYLLRLNSNTASIVKKIIIEQ